MNTEEKIIQPPLSTLERIGLERMTEEEKALSRQNYINNHEAEIEAAIQQIAEAIVEIEIEAKVKKMKEEADAEVQKVKTKIRPSFIEYFSSFMAERFDAFLSELQRADDSEMVQRGLGIAPQSKNY